MVRCQPLGTRLHSEPRSSQLFISRDPSLPRRACQLIDSYSSAGERDFQPEQTPVTPETPGFVVRPRLLLLLVCLDFGQSKSIQSARTARRQHHHKGANKANARPWRGAGDGGWSVKQRWQTVPQQLSGILFFDVRPYSPARLTALKLCRANILLLKDAALYGAGNGREPELFGEWWEEFEKKKEKRAVVSGSPRAGFGQL